MSMSSTPERSGRLGLWLVVPTFIVCRSFYNTHKYDTLLLISAVGIAYLGWENIKHGCSGDLILTLDSLPHFLQLDKESKLELVWHTVITWQTWNIKATQKLPHDVLHNLCESPVNHIPLKYNTKPNWKRLTSPLHILKRVLNNWRVQRRATEKIYKLGAKNPILQRGI